MYSRSSKPYPSSTLVQIAISRDFGNLISLVMSGICNAAQNIGQFAIVRIKLNYGNIMVCVELQIQ